MRRIDKRKRAAEESAGLEEYVPSKFDMAFDRHVNSNVVKGFNLCEKLGWIGPYIFVTWLYTSGILALILLHLACCGIIIGLVKLLRLVF